MFGVLELISSHSLEDKQQKFNEKRCEPPRSVFGLRSVANV